MKFKMLFAAFFAAALSCAANAQATLLPNAELCFQANVGVNGMIGLLGSITGGSGGTPGAYGGVAITGGSGSNATANIVVGSSGNVTSVTILNPGVQFVVGDVISAASGTIGGVTGFSVGVASTSINSSLAGGSVGFYIPSTLTTKQTWQDSAETILNQNPTPLDANGCAIVWGGGFYRMIVKDSLGNTVFDQITASTGPSGIFWAGTAGGTGNAITVTDTNFALQDGATIQFRAIAQNSGPTTISVSGAPPIAIVKDTGSGPAALSGTEIGIGNTPMVTYDLPNNEFHIVNPSAGGSSAVSSSITPPQGYLNLVGQASGDVIQTGDVVGATTLFYSPFVGNLIPIFNGTVFVNTVISELTLSLTGAGSPSNTIQDACVFANNGVPTIVLGPSWTTVSAGNGARGTGAGSAQITRQGGLWVNAVSIIGYNGPNSYTIPASQCTYVGSVSIDASAGQISAYRSYGQSRKFGVWNAYNRVHIHMEMGDGTGIWNYNTSTVRPANNNTNNSITTFTGLPEEVITLSETQTVTVNNAGPGLTAIGGTAKIGFGINSTTAFSGTPGTSTFSIVVVGSTLADLVTNQLSAKASLSPGIGINVLTVLESTSLSTNTNISYLGAVSAMLATADYAG